MTVNLAQLNQIKEQLEIVASFGVETSDVDAYLLEEEVDELPDEMEIDEICLTFPDDIDYTKIPTEDFIDYMTDIGSIKRLDRKTVLTNHISQTVISSSRKGYTAFEDKLSSFTFKGEGIEAHITERPFLIGLMNAKERQYDEDFGFGACEPYTAIEIHSEELLNGRLVEETVERICFYLSKRLGVGVYPSEIADFSEFYYRIDEFYDDKEDDEDFDVDISSIPKYSSLLRMYRLAKSIEDPEIQFLQYYKILENVSKNVAKKIAFDSINDNLDSLKHVEEDSSNLDTILSVFKQYDLNNKDDVLPLVVLEHCTDCFKVFEMMPVRLQNHIKSNLSVDKDELKEGDLSEDQKVSLRKQMAKILYSTRNRIVHAKLNYTNKGIEINDDELEEANEMMSEIAVSIIKWNFNQVDGFRI